MVANVKVRTSSLKSFIVEATGAPTECIKVSDVKGDRTVFVRLRSSAMVSAFEFLRRFCEALDVKGLDYENVGETQVRLSIEQF